MNSDYDNGPWDAEPTPAEQFHAARSDHQRARAAARRRAIANCPLCDDDGYVGVRLCDHDTEAAARAERGIALVYKTMGWSR